MTSRAQRAVLYAKARSRLAEIVLALVALHLEDDAEARAMALAEFIASTDWPERTARIALEASLRELTLSPEELEEETAKLLLRIREPSKLLDSSESNESRSSQSSTSRSFAPSSH